MFIVRFFIVTLFILLISGCGLSNEEIGSTVKNSMNEMFLTDERFREMNLTVDTVEIIKHSDQYKGLAKVKIDDSSYNVVIQVTVDGDKIMWEAPPGSFMFVVQHRMKKELEKLQKLAN